MVRNDPDMSPQAKAVAAAAIAGTDSHCASHKRDVWAIDGEKKSLRARLDWHRFVLLVVAVLVIGIVCTVYYDSVYYTSGAWLVKQKGDVNAGVQQAKMETGVEMEIGVPQETMLLLERGATDGESVCGEQMDSCRAYNQPNICCPAGMICHITNFTLSGVYCCAKDSACLATSDKPPRCDEHAQTCNKSLGGGCCAPGTECTPGGCLKTYRAEPGFAPSLLSGTQKPPTRTYTETTTKTETEGVTVTAPRIGETAQSSDGVKEVEAGFGFSSYPKLELLALGCALAVSYAMVLRG